MQYCNIWRDTKVSVNFHWRIPFIGIFCLFYNTSYFINQYTLKINVEKG